jgi:regulatory protein
MTMSSPHQSISESREGQAHALCLRLLTARSRTRAELTGQLQKRGYPDEVIATVLERLAGVGLVDDAEFADQWVRSRERTGKGNRALAAQLKTKGIADDVIASTLGGFDTDSERARAERFVEQKLRRETLGDNDNANEAKVARRLVGMLARRGYSQSLAISVVTEGLAAERERRRV